MGRVRVQRIPPGLVTATDVMAAVDRLSANVATVLTKVEVMEASRRADTVQLADHEARLRVVQDAMPPNLESRLLSGEKWRWQVAAVLSFFAVVSGVASGWIGTILAHAHP